MKEIKCIYKNSKEKIIPYDKLHGRIIENMIESLNQKSGLHYINFISSELEKIYIDDELVVDKQSILKEV